MNKKLFQVLFITLVFFVISPDVYAACCSSNDIGKCSASGCGADQECISSNDPGGLDSCRRQSKGTCTSSDACKCASTEGAACGSAANNRHCCESLGLTCDSRNNPVCVKNDQCSTGSCNSHTDCCPGLECLDIAGSDLGSCGSPERVGRNCSTDNACYPNACDPGQCCYCSTTTTGSTVKKCKCRSEVIYEEEYKKAYEEAKARSPFYDLFYKGPIVQNIESILNPLGKILFWGGLFIGMAFIVIAGYTLMTSEGNPQKTQEGQEQLTAAILGIAFILLSSAILRVIISLT